MKRLIIIFLYPIVLRKAFALIFLSIVFFSCQDDTNDQSVDPAETEAQEIIENSANSAVYDIITLVESEGVNALKDLELLLEQHDFVGGRFVEKGRTKHFLSTIKEYFVVGPTKRVGFDTPTTLDEIKGLYVWNFETEEFDISASDFFIVQFPSEDSEVNDAEFKISQLEYETVEDESSSLVAPSLLRGYLKIDNITLVDISYDVKWSITGPMEANVSLFISPFTLDVAFIDSFERETSLLSSISLSGETIIGVDVDVVYETNRKDDALVIEGNTQYRNLKIDGNIDLRKMESSGDPNTYIDLELQSSDSKIGDIFFKLEDVKEDEKDFVPYVLYADGNQQSLESFLTPILQEIEEILSEFD